MEPTHIRLCLASIQANILTKFQQAQAKKSASIFELGLEISKVYKLNKFYEDQTIIVASRVLTSKLLTTDKRGSQKLTLSISCSGDLKSYWMNIYVKFF